MHSRVFFSSARAPDLAPQDKPQQPAHRAGQPRSAQLRTMPAMHLRARRQRFRAVSSAACAVSIHRHGLSVRLLSRLCRELRQGGLLRAAGQIMELGPRRSPVSRHAVGAAAAAGRAQAAATQLRRQRRQLVRLRKGRHVQRGARRDDACGAVVAQRQRLRLGVRQHAAKVWHAAAALRARAGAKGGAARRSGDWRSQHSGSNAPRAPAAARA